MLRYHRKINNVHHTIWKMLALRFYLNISKFMSVCQHQTHTSVLLFLSPCRCFTLSTVGARTQTRMKISWKINLQCATARIHTTQHLCVRVCVRVSALHVSMAQHMQNAHTLLFSCLNNFGGSSAKMWKDGGKFLRIRAHSAHVYTQKENRRRKNKYHGIKFCK